MASPSRASGLSRSRLTVKDEAEARTRSRSSTTRLTQSQLAKVVKDECHKIMHSVSSIYSPAELEAVEKREAAREFEPDSHELAEGDPNRPPGPTPHSDAKDFDRQRMLEGLEGVLDAGRGKIEDWLDELRTQRRKEQLQELDEWFDHFQERGPELAKFFRTYESEAEQGRILCQRSQIFVEKLSKGTVHTRQEVEQFVDTKLKPIAGAAGQGGMVHAAEKKRSLAQIHYDESHEAAQAVEHQVQETEEALAQAKQDWYEQRIGRMRMQQAEQEEARKLEEEIERRPDERVCIGLTLPWERAGRFLLVLRLKLRSPVCKGRCHVTVSE
ncbi:unnamed protein product [Effrenium voratum]|nr:unnamed protein product [Effrenium voratum]